MKFMIRLGLRFIDHNILYGGELDPHTGWLRSVNFLIQRGNDYAKLYG